MAKSKKQSKKTAAATPPAEEQQPEQQQEATAQADGAGDQPAPAFTAAAEDDGPLPPIGTLVYFWERENIVRASERNEAPTPHAAIVTGVESLDGVDGLLQLIEFHPSAGATVRRHIRRGLRVANAWSPGPLQPVGVPMSLLVEAVNQVIAMAGVDIPAAPQPPTPNPPDESIDGEKT